MFKCISKGQILHSLTELLNR